MKFLELNGHPQLKGKDAAKRIALTILMFQSTDKYCRAEDKYLIKCCDLNKRVFRRNIKILIEKGIVAKAEFMHPMYGRQSFYLIPDVPEFKSARYNHKAYSDDENDLSCKSSFELGEDMA